MNTLNAVYRERSQLVAALSKVFPASLEVDPDARDWSVCIIELPTGQVSWHISPDDLDFFSHLYWNVDRMWDGHDTETKYQRLSALAQPQPAPDALREALEFYADPDSYADMVFGGRHAGLPVYTTAIVEDGGAKARAALGEGE